MSWATCYSGSNNTHFDFPPIMSDGRNFASWQPDAVVNETIQKQVGIRSNWEYRQYMINNATSIMKLNNTEACSSMGLNPYAANSNPEQTPTSNTPYLFKTMNDRRRGNGIEYPPSDLKNPYLTREQLQSRMISPSIVPPHSSSSLR